MTAPGKRVRFGMLATRLPRWLRITLACLALALGVVIITRPTTALGVLALLIGAGLVIAGLLDLSDVDEGSPRAPVRVVMAVVWVAAGLWWQ